MSHETPHEFPNDLKYQVSLALNEYLPDNKNKWRDIVHECLISLENHPFIHELTQSTKTTICFVRCMIDLLADVEKKVDITLGGFGTASPVGGWIVKNIVIPTVEKGPYDLLEAKLYNGENPFIPKQLEQKPVKINHNLVKQEFIMSLN